MEKISYWVFTSGEKGIHGLDWGVKFASPVFNDLPALDIHYRALLRDFSLTPSLKRPAAEDVGLLILPDDSNSTLLGFIFQGIDHQKRPNTSTVICVIPFNLRQTMSLPEAASVIFRCNDLNNIAHNNYPNRPDFLKFTEDSPTDIFSPASNLEWPKQVDCYLQVDGKIEKFTRSIHEEKAPESKRAKLIAGAVLVICAVSGVSFYVLREWRKPANVERNVLVSNVPTQSGKVSNDVQSKDKTAPSATERPDISSYDKIVEVFLAEVLPEVTTTENSSKDSVVDEASREFEEKVTGILNDLLAGQNRNAFDFDIVSVDNVETSSKFGNLYSRVINKETIINGFSDIIHVDRPNTSKGKPVFYWRKGKSGVKNEKDFNQTKAKVKRGSLFTANDMSITEKSVDEEFEHSLRETLSEKLSQRYSECFALRLFFRTRQADIFLVYVMKYQSNSFMSPEKYIVTSSKNLIPVSRYTDPFQKMKYGNLGMIIEISDVSDNTTFKDCLVQLINGG